MPTVESPNFAAEFPSAVAQLDDSGAQRGDPDQRIEQWRRDEWHNWFRWRVCRKGFDWSKPAWILTLAAGFGAFILYGWSTQKYFVTAGGVVFWFTFVNLAFFAYFGLTLPGPPRLIPGSFTPGQRVRATIGLYPAGYERRKLARVCVRVANPRNENMVFELTFPQLPRELDDLLQRQQTWRIQRGDAPATEAVIETTHVTREQINAGEHPLVVRAWRWDEQRLEPFDRTKT